MDIDALARLARHGDTQAQDRLVALVRPGLRGVAKRTCARPEDAEDGLQQGILHVIDHLDRWDPDRPFLPWAARTVHNACIDLHRRGGRERPTDDGEPPVPSPEEPPLDVDARIDAARLQNRVRAALVALPPLYREALVLHHWDHLSCKEIADRLAVAEGTVMNRLFRARRKMLALLGDGARP